MFTLLSTGVTYTLCESDSMQQATHRITHVTLHHTGDARPLRPENLRTYLEDGTLRRMVAERLQ